MCWFFILHTCSSFVLMEFKIFRWACTCISDFIISFDAMFHNRKYRQTPDLWLLFTPINNFFYPSLCSLSGNNFWMAVSLPYLKIERDSFQDEFYYTWNFLRIQWNFHKDPLKISYIKDQISSTASIPWYLVYEIIFSYNTTSSTFSKLSNR